MTETPCLRQFSQRSAMNASLSSLRVPFGRPPFPKAALRILLRFGPIFAFFKLRHGTRTPRGSFDLSQFSGFPPFLPPVVPSFDSSSSETSGGLSRYSTPSSLSRRSAAVLKDDKRAIFTVASHAQKAADYLHGLQPQEAQS